MDFLRTARIQHAIREAAFVLRRTTLAVMLTLLAAYLGLVVLSEHSMSRRLDVLITNAGHRWMISVDTQVVIIQPTSDWPQRNSDLRVDFDTTTAMAVHLPFSHDSAAGMPDDAFAWRCGSFIFCRGNFSYHYGGFVIYSSLLAWVGLCLVLLTVAWWCWRRAGKVAAMAARRRLFQRFAYRLRRRRRRWLMAMAISTLICAAVGIAWSTTSTCTPGMVIGHGRVGYLTLEVCHGRLWAAFQTDTVPSQAVIYLYRCETDDVWLQTTRGVLGLYAGPDGPPMRGLVGAASVPLWLLMVLLLLAGVLAWRRARRCDINRVLARGLCLHCGYDLRATPERCPECGKPAVRRETT